MNWQNIKTGKLEINVFDFSEGFGLPMHAHTEADNHISIVARGSFRVTGDKGERFAKTGDILDFDVGELHQITALEPCSRLINVMK